MRTLKLGRIAATMCGALALVAAVLSTPSAASTTATFVVSANGAGTTCTAASPCALTTALGRASGGERISLLGGTYEALTTQSYASLKNATTNVIVEPSPGADPVMRGLSSGTPHVTWRNLSFTGTVWINASATQTIVDRVRIDGSGLYVRSKDVTVRDSEISNGFNTDGIQVGRAENVLLQGNRIHDFRQQTGSSLHSDCIQVFDSKDVTIRGNRLRDCYNSGLIFSVGSGWGIQRVLVESNFIQGCITVTPDCKRGSSSDLRETSASDVIVRNNTFTHGSFRAIAVPGSSFDRNIVDYMSTCDTPLTNSVVTSWNKGMCPQPPVLTTKGNRSATPSFVNADAGDLYLRSLDSASVTPVGVAFAAAKSVDGDAMRSTTAGAAEMTPTPRTPADDPTEAGPPDAVPSPPRVVDPPLPSPTPTAIPTTSPAPAKPTTAPATPPKAKVSTNVIRIVAPTSRKKGRITIVVRALGVSRGNSLAAASTSRQLAGSVTVTFKKRGKHSRQTTKTLTSGARHIRIPRLTRGTWKIYVSYSGSSAFLRSPATYEGRFTVRK